MWGTVRRGAGASLPTCSPTTATAVSRPATCRFSRYAWLVTTRVCRKELLASYASVYSERGARESAGQRNTRAAGAAWRYELLHSDAAF